MIPEDRPAPPVPDAPEATRGRVRCGVIGDHPGHLWDNTNVADSRQVLFWCDGNQPAPSGDALDTEVEAAWERVNTHGGRRTGKTHARRVLDAYVAERERAAAKKALHALGRHFAQAGMGEAARMAGRAADRKAGGVDE